MAEYTARYIHHSMNHLNILISGLGCLVDLFPQETSLQQFGYKQLPETHLSLKIVTINQNSNDQITQHLNNVGNHIRNAMKQFNENKLSNEKK